MKLAWITGAVQGGVSFLFSGYGGDLDGFEVMEVRGGFVFVLR
jgi:hypothetical protein